MKLSILVSLVFIFTFSDNIIAQTRTGHIKFKINTDSAYVVIGNDYFTAQKVASGDTIKLNRGVRLLKLFTPYAKSGSLYTMVYADSVVTLNHIFKKGNLTPEDLSDNIAARYHYDANVMVLTDDDSDIYYKGSYLGTGFAAFNAPEEIGQIEVKNPDFGTSKRTIAVKERQINYVEEYNRPLKSFSKVYSFLPGASQLYKRQYEKSAALGLSNVALITFAALKNAAYKDELDLFNKYNEDYQNASTEQDALRLGDIAEEQQDVVSKLDNQRRFLFLSALVLYAYNIYDGFTSKPAGGYLRKDKDLEFYLSQEQISGTLNPTGTLRYNF